MKILIVDDSKAMRSIVIRNLDQAGFSGHSIVEAENGKEALSSIIQEPPDLVLSDWNMPVMTGIQLLEEINTLTRSNKLAKSIAFVFITSESTQAVLNNAKYNGALRVIAKPFTPKDLQEKLTDLIK